MAAFRTFGKGRGSVGITAFLLFCLLTGGCSSSVLVRPGDAVFAESQERLEKTLTRVEHSGASPGERALFLQAESFYRYRFEPPARAKISFLAEAAAAATDFPALQSLAGSVDLHDLRLRAPDAAIQLWETELVRYPRSPLSPLVLYRLGWAYRNAGAVGLPREEPKEAFDQLRREAPDSELARLAGEAREVPWKSKSTAASWSLVPGLGQLYVGETGNGVTRLVIGLAAATAVAYPAYQALHRGSELSWSNDWGLLALGLGGLIVLSFDYTSSYEDAMRGVVQWNERAESRFNREHPSAP